MPDYIANETNLSYMPLLLGYFTKVAISYAPTAYKSIGNFVFWIYAVVGQQAFNMVWQIFIKRISRSAKVNIIAMYPPQISIKNNTTIYFIINARRKRIMPLISRRIIGQTKPTKRDRIANRFVIST